MKNEWLITFRSVTFAQRGERILRNHRIACQMQRTPKHLTERGCGYCLRLESVDVPEAMAIFHREKLHRRGTTDPAQFYSPSHRSRRCGFLNIV